MQEKEIYEKALKYWGIQSQTDMMIEEASELIQAILKNRRGLNTRRNVLSEVVDCQIMLDQMKLILNDDEEYNRIKIYKLERVEILIKKEENNRTMRFRLNERFEKLAELTNQEA